MSRFRATVHGNRGETSRLGGKESGINARINGWDFGVAVSGRVNDEGEDEFHIYLTGGSNGSMREYALGTYTRSQLEAKLKDGVTV